MLLSVIVPCYNEEGNIDLFYEETVKALGDLMPETELIFVNDGSRDSTIRKLRSLCERAEYRVRVVSFPAISARRLRFWQVLKLHREHLHPLSTRIFSRILRILWK